MMRLQRFFSLILIVTQIFPVKTFGVNQDSDPVTTSLQISQEVDFTFIPTRHLYNSLCGRPLNSPTWGYSAEICDVVVKSDVCKEVAPQDLLSCTQLEDTSQIDIWQFIKGCANGVFDSVKEMLGFVWDLLKWSWSHATSSEARGKSYDQATEYMNAVKLYLSTEYEKAYAKSTGMFRTINALASMTGTISMLIMKGITDIISKKYQEFGCLNFQAKSKIICKFVGDTFLPPAAGLAFLKYGAKAADMFPNVKKAMNALDELNKIKRTQLDRMKRAIPIVGKRFKVEKINDGKPILSDLTKSRNDGSNLLENAYNYNFNIRNGASGKSVRVVIAPLPDGREDLKTLNKIKKVFGEMPEEGIGDLNKIVVHKRKSIYDDHYKRESGYSENGAISDTAGTNRDIHFFPSAVEMKPLRETTEIMQHELGHILAKKKYGTPQPDADWKHAADIKDGTSVSPYGNTSSSEDFAEAMRVYLSTDGGLRDPESLKNFAGRFEILDDVMKMGDAQRAEVIRELKSRMLQKKIFWTAATVNGVAQITSISEGNQTRVLDDNTNPP